MSKRKAITEDIESVKEAMEKTKSKAEFRRLQCVYLGDTRPDVSAKEIGQITLFTESNVKKIHSAFRKAGLDSVKDRRGGRYRENLTIEQEDVLLKQFEGQSEAGKLIEASKIKEGYEKELGRKVNKSTVYRMLDRRGFRKIVPYKRHPKANKEEQETFKKTFQI